MIDSWVRSLLSRMLFQQQMERASLFFSKGLCHHPHDAIAAVDRISFFSLICPPVGLRQCFPDPALPDKSSISCEPQFKISLSSVKAEAVNYNYFWFSCPSEQLSWAAAPLTRLCCWFFSMPAEVLEDFRILQPLSISILFPQTKVFPLILGLLPPLPPHSHTVSSLMWRPCNTKEKD